MGFITLISIIIVVSSMIATIILSFVITYKYPSANYVELLQNYFVFNHIHTFDTILNIIQGIFIIPSIIGVLLLFRSKVDEKIKNWLVVPTITTILGSLLLISLVFLKFKIIFQLAPEYNIAAGEAKDEIFAIFENWVKVIFILQVVAYVLIFSLGAGIFGIASFKYQVTKETQTWLALLCGILGLCEVGVFILGTAGSVFTFLASIASILFFFWLGGMGLAVIQRIKEKKLEFTEEISVLEA